MEAYLILGPTGVGKTPLGKKLESNGIAGKKVHHFDFGKQLRVVCEYRDPLFTTAELSFLDEVLNEGRLLENDQFYIARKIFRAFQEKAEIDLDEDIVLMNGLPRHIGQAKVVNEFANFSGVISLECDEGTIFERLKNNIGGDRTERTDDEISLVTKKISTYQERTRPLIDYFSEQDVPIYRIHVTADMDGETCYQELVSQL